MITLDMGKHQPFAPVQVSQREETGRIKDFLISEEMCRVDQAEPCTALCLRSFATSWS